MPFKFLRNLTACFITFVRYVTCAFAHTALLDFTCKQMATMKHGDLDRHLSTIDCHLSTAIDYPFRELVFQKRTGSTKVRGFHLTKIFTLPS